jgi:ABC-2 type transport system ATP-binding protein
VDVIANPHEVRKKIGFLPENPPLYTDMRVNDYLAFAGEIRGMSRDAIKKRMPDVLGLTDLTAVEDEVIGTLSHGFRQRVGVAQAIIHGPKFLILDEPTRGLDPVQIVEMRKLIHSLKEKHTVLISSHILTEISQTCDRLMMLDRGRVLGIGSEQELAGKETEIRSVTITVKTPSGDPFRSDPKGQITRVLKGVDGVTEVSGPIEQVGGLTFNMSTTKDCRAEVSRAVVEAKLDLIKLDHARSELETTFMRLVGGADGSN